MTSTSARELAAGAGDHAPSAVVAPARPRHQTLLVQAPVLAAGFTALAVLYVLALHFSLDATRVDADTTASERDSIYFGIHGAVLLLAGISGFALGRWTTRLGLTWCAGYLLGIFAVMAAVQLGSYELACRGHNDLVRHWTCERP